MRTLQNSELLQVYGGGTTKAPSTETHGGGFIAPVVTGGKGAEAGFTAATPGGTISGYGTIGPGGTYGIGTSYTFSSGGNQYSVTFAYNATDQLVALVLSMSF
jgi:hypothetical protein